MRISQQVKKLVQAQTCLPDDRPQRAPGQMAAAHGDDRARPRSVGIAQAVVAGP
jgi:hypothetical protein